MTVTLLLAAALVVGGGLLRPRTTIGLRPSVFQARRAQWRHCADVVLAGDSRTYRGALPREMKPILGDRRILNYGYDAVGFGREYLQAVENVLDPAADGRMIVLGVTPHALTRDAAARNAFRNTRQELKRRSIVDRRLEPYVAFFDPMDLDDMLTTVFPSLRRRAYYEDYRPDGSVPGRREPEQPLGALDKYKEQFAAHPVSGKLIDGLMAVVQSWRAKGIRVVGYRVPTCPQMVRLEDEFSGLTAEGWTDFIRRFHAAGGTWIDMDQGAYHSYDGSHIRDREAADFSRDLAREIRNVLPPDGH